MKKKYINPNIITVKVVTQQMIAGTTPGINPGDDTTPEESDAKGFGFFDDANPVPTVGYSIWEE